MGQSGVVFMILGIVFITIGLSGQRTFLWIGIPFLVTGITGLAISQAKGKSKDSQEAAPTDEDH